MKNLFVLFLITFAVTQVMSTSLDDEQEWTNYKVKFNKYYGSTEEEQRRMKIFQENKRMIEEHNAKYEKGEVSFKMGLNRFSDMTTEEFQQMMGLKTPIVSKLTV